MEVVHPIATVSPHSVECSQSSASSSRSWSPKIHLSSDANALHAAISTYHSIPTLKASVIDPTLRETEFSKNPDRLRTDSGDMLKERALKGLPQSSLKLPDMTEID